MEINVEWRKKCGAGHGDTMAIAMHARGCLQNPPAGVPIARERIPPGKCRLMASRRWQRRNFPLGNFYPESLGPAEAPFTMNVPLSEIGLLHLQTSISKDAGGKISGKPQCRQRPSGTPQYHRWSTIQTVGRHSCWRDLTIPMPSLARGVAILLPARNGARRAIRRRCEISVRGSSGAGFFPRAFTCYLALCYVPLIC